MAGTEGIRIVEVGPRDGLQNLATFVATDQKIGLIRELAACGLGEIQIGGFVHPQAIPQFQDIREVAAGVNGLAGVKLTALVPNLRGARTAAACGLRKLNFFYSVSRSHNRSNVRQTPEESLAALKTIREELFPDGIEIRVDLATAFGCPFEGRIPIGAVLQAVEETANLGIREITLCDTVGFGNPRLVEEIARACRERFPDVAFGMHFHNTRGLGLANTFAAYQAGIRTFDASLGGLGGCPFAPGASGNTATEDTAFLFAEMGVGTGVDLPALLETARRLQEILPDIPLTSALSRAGLPRRADFPCPS
ncbi:MAG: hydroxymethylglutaryl-CoA lyase [Deltaproteobacteria bacterium]|nr:hydroxymethylglutaryl-CoA lyase [Deltaproteobacteria bacterium]